MAYRETPGALTLPVQREEGKRVRAHSLLYYAYAFALLALPVGVYVLVENVWFASAVAFSCFVLLVSFTYPWVEGRAYRKALSLPIVRIEPTRVVVPLCDGEQWSFDRRGLGLDAAHYWHQQLVRGRSQIGEGVYVFLVGGGRRITLVAQGKSDAKSWGLPFVRALPPADGEHVLVWSRDLLRVAFSLGLCRSEGAFPRRNTPFYITRGMLSVVAIFIAAVALFIGAVSAFG